MSLSKKEGKDTKHTRGCQPKVPKPHRFPALGPSQTKGCEPNFLALMAHSLLQNLVTGAGLFVGKLGLSEQVLRLLQSWVDEPEEQTSLMGAWVQLWTLGAC